MYTIYGKGGQRHQKIAWLLAEMKLPFETVPLDLIPGGHTFEKLLELNPFAKVPILQDGDFVIWESAAILNYLIDKHREIPMAPVAGSEERAHHDKWFFMAHTDFEEPLWNIAKHKFVYAESLRSESAVAAARKDWKNKIEILEKIFPATQFLNGDTFSAADIALSYVLNWGRNIELLKDSPKVEAYLLRCTERPSCPFLRDR